MLLSTPCTSKPRRSKYSTASDPMSPALPVTRTFTSPGRLPGAMSDSTTDARRRHPRAVLAPGAGRHGARHPRHGRGHRRRAATWSRSGSSARHRAPGAGGVAARRSPSGRCRCRGSLLYESWQRLRRPRGGAGDRAVDVVHSTAHVAAASHRADGRDRPRPPLPPRAVALHPARASACSPASSTWSGTRPRWWCARRRRPASTARRPGSTARGCGSPRGRPTPSRWRPSEAGAGARGVRAAPPVRAVRRHDRAPEEPGSAGRGLRRARRRRRRAGDRGPGGVEHRPGGAGRSAGAAARVRARPPTGTRSTPPRRSSPTRACGRGSGCRCSRRWCRAPRW